MDSTKSSSLSVENVDTSCWTISARCRLFRMLSTFSVPTSSLSLLHSGLPFLSLFLEPVHILAAQIDLKLTHCFLNFNCRQYGAYNHFFSTNVSTSFTSLPFNFSHSFAVHQLKAALCHLALKT